MGRAEVESTLLQRAEKIANLEELDVVYEYASDPDNDLSEYIPIITDSTLARLNVLKCTIVWIIIS